MPKKKTDRRNIGLFVFGADWRAERTLMLCSEGARLLWFEILLLMAENEGQDKGFLLVNGKRPTPSQIATLTRTDPEKVGARLLELEENGVFSRDRRGVVFSRRIVRDELKARTARANGRQGGNPSLCPAKDIPPSDNQNGPDPDKTNTLTPSKTLKANHEETESLPPPAEPAPLPDPSAALWALCRALMPGANAGGIAGRWCGKYGEHNVYRAVTEFRDADARRKRADPVSWITDRLKRYAAESGTDDAALRAELNAIEERTRATLN